MNKKKILVTCPRIDESKSKFIKYFQNNEFDYQFLYPESQQFSESEMIKLFENVNVAIVGDDIVSENVISSSNDLEYIIKWGSGTDNINRKTAELKNIRIFNTPNILGKYVAEYGLGMLIDLIKNISKTDRQVRNKNWQKNENFTLFNSKIGFFGFGDVANEFAKLLTPFSPSISYCDVVEKECNYKRLSFEKLLINNEIVIVTSNLTADNKEVFDKSAFQKMGRDSYLINISRGGLINEEDLVVALNNLYINGAALDVYKEEPLPKDSELRIIDNVLLGTHNASNVSTANIEVNEYILNLMGEIL